MCWIPQGQGSLIADVLLITQVETPRTREDSLLDLTAAVVQMKDQQ